MPIAKRIEVDVVPTPAWRSSRKTRGKSTKWLARSGNFSSPALSRRTCLSGSNDEGHVRCASAKRRPAHTMSRMLPMNRISCSGADPLQIHRSHCTNTAKGNGNASRLGRGTAAPERYPGTRGVSKIASNGSTCALRLTNLKLWMAPATELVRTRDRSCRAPVITSCRYSDQKDHC